MTETDFEDYELTLKLFIVSSRANKSLMELGQKMLQPFGLNLTEFAVLELLFHKGPHTLQQIRDKVLIASSSITYVIDQLEKKGHLLRKTCETDRRITFAHLEEKGLRLMEEVFPRHAASIQEIMSVLSKGEKKTAIRIMKKLGFHVRDKLSEKSREDD